MVTQRITHTNHHGYPHGARQWWSEMTTQFNLKVSTIGYEYKPVIKTNSSHISFTAGILVEWAVSCLEELFLAMFKFTLNWDIYSHSYQVDYACQVHCAYQGDCEKQP